MCFKRLIEVELKLILLAIIVCSSASAEVLFYTDGTTVGSNWTLTNCTLESDGHVLRQRSTSSGYASLDFGFSKPVNEFTMVFDFKVSNPGQFIAAYVAPPNEGMYVSSLWVAKDSRSATTFMDIKPNTWYSMAIYTYGSYGYQQFWIAEGKQTNLFNVSSAYRFGASAWTGSSRASFYACGNGNQYPLSDWEFDNIRINSGVDLTGGNPVSVATPVFTPDDIVISKPTPITITTATEGAKIYYTTDGTTPTTESAFYSDPVIVRTGITLKAMAWTEEYKPSYKAITFISKTIPIVAWYGIQGGSSTSEKFHELREAGFTHSFATYATVGLVQEALDVAESEGIKVLTNIVNPLNSFVLQFYNHPALAGYYIQDEPKTDDFASLAAQVRTIHALDTNHFCYINLFPNVATLDQLGASSYQSYVESFINTVPVELLSFDHYPITTSNNSYSYAFYKNLEIISSAARDADVPFWAFARTVSYADYCIPTLTHFRFQMFNNLAYGAQGLQYFTYWQPPDYGSLVFHDSPININGQRTAMWYLVQSMNQEIKGLSGVFLGAEVVRVGHTGSSIPSGTTKYTAASPIFSLTTTGSDGAVVSEMINGKNRYLVVVNRDLVSTMTLNISVNTARNLSKVSKDGMVIALTSGAVQYTVDPADIVILNWTAIPGDANWDDVVDVGDLGDLGILAVNYGKASGAIWKQGDFNGDGTVDVGDLGILAANYGTNSKSSMSWEAACAQVFVITANEDKDSSEDESESDEETSSSLCSGLGLSLIAVLLWAGLVPIKFKN